MYRIPAVKICEDDVWTVTLTESFNRFSRCLIWREEYINVWPQSCWVQCFYYHLLCACFTVEFAAPEEWNQLYGDSWKSGPLFVVFRGSDRKLKAFSAVYDPVTGKLTFKSDVAGNYVIVYYPYLKENVVLFSDAFYSGLEQMEAVRVGLPLLLSR